MPLPVLLTNADYVAIRASIRADLSVDDLPDTIVQMGFSPAIAQLVNVDTLAGTYPDGSEEAVRAHDAAVLLAAAYIVGMVPQITRESFQGYSYGIQPIDSAARAAELRALAYELLALNLGADAATLLRPRMMDLAPGGRGDTDDSRYSPVPAVEVWP